MTCAPTAKRPGWLPATGLAAFLVAILVLSAGALPAQARDLNLPAFFGHWQGTGISETEDSIYFRVTSRDMDVRISGADQGGFRIVWTTVQRQSGAADNPNAERKTTEMMFLPTGRKNVWKSQTAADPMTGTYAWATLQGATLSINTFVIQGNGDFRLHVYKRTITGLGMELDFIAFADGEAARTVSARLVKVGN
ncbi:hypothetical protein ACFOGJ_20315 [Marinibaculum pumilum]|uniref:DUF1794 domain-containing protein n=1 Tax=Marinibaculum pumilum TaxID=1766165 RepID=A0ABV7L4X8_9PROT